MKARERKGRRGEAGNVSRRSLERTKVVMKSCCFAPAETFQVRPARTPFVPAGCNGEFVGPVECDSNPWFVLIGKSASPPEP